MGTLEILTSEKRYKLNTATLDGEINVDEKELKREILEIVNDIKIEGLTFDYTTGWMQFEKNIRNTASARYGRKYGITLMLISIPFLFFNPVFGIIILGLGIFAYRNGTIQIKSADGEDIDMVGASAVGLHFANL